eukprot:scaffold23141_cov133-Skeletonema_marinoi.AAC.5
MSAEYDPGRALPPAAGHAIRSRHQMAFRCGMIISRVQVHLHRDTEAITTEMMITHTSLLGGNAATALLVPFTSCATKTESH